ncbi:MAG TPA: hypothetical protein VFC99_03435 [Acidimicrobiia bacterium]|nr:hypothetical protein [Acidimicrobiia bacterium]
MHEPVGGTSWYVARRVDAPAFVVADLVRWLLAEGPITVETDGAALTVAAVEPGRLALPSPLAVIRAGRGRLTPRRRRLRPGGRVRVDLEVEAWSAGACELALRPSARRPPANAPAYGAAAAAALDRLRDVVVRLLGTPEERAEPVPLRRAS